MEEIDPPKEEKVIGKYSHVFLWCVSPNGENLKSILSIATGKFKSLRESNVEVLSDRTGISTPKERSRDKRHGSLVRVDSTDIK